MVLALAEAQLSQHLQGSEQGRVGTSPHVTPDGNAASQQLLGLDTFLLPGF